MPLRERLHGLASFLAEFETPGFKFGEWCGGELLEDNVRVMPWHRLSPAAHRFYKACYELDWVRKDFGWSEWSSSPEAERLLGPNGVESASVEDLERLITMIVRADRFCEGYLAGSFESGLVLRILRRAAELERALR